MFGYVTISTDNLDQPGRDRFRAHYCGLCRALDRHGGAAARLTLSYDMTFLAVLLNALYEPGETAGRARCAMHPVHPRDYVTYAAMEYVADMNLALAYHKCADDWHDDRNMMSAAEGRLLKEAYASVASRYPEKCRAVEGWIEVIRDIEASDPPNAIDAAVNATGAMLGELFAWHEGDLWERELRAIGDGLGRFIYFMDAYEDLEGDLRHGRYNPLRALAELDGYETLCREALLQMAADATDAFERLPIVLDADILRNILYSGIWTRYGHIQRKRFPKDKGEN